MDVIDLPKEDLEKSKTYRKYVNAVAMCAQCKEMCSPLYVCCGNASSFEGGFLSAMKLWEKIEEELWEAK